uniref:CW-type domain-containing protein n=1 Tax=Entomoneis paludosa TaxID=265537 RepID=A0A7S2YDY5_9STRA
MGKIGGTMPSSSVLVLIVTVLLASQLANGFVRESRTPWGSPNTHHSKTGSAKLNMVFDFVRERSKEGLDQLSKLGDAAKVGQLGKGLSEAAAYTSQTNQAFAVGLAKSRVRLLENLDTFLTGVSPEDMIEDLTDILLQADLGIATAEDIAQEVKSLRADSTKLLSKEDLKSIMRGKLVEALDTQQSGAIQFSSVEGQPTVLFVMGANGMGKTTTIGKLAHRLKTEANQTVLMAACDTFRAGAVEQLQQWADRAEVEMVGPNEKATTPSAVLYAALDKAVAEKYDTLLVDTSGRLSNNDQLTQELFKMKRVIQKRLSVETDDDGKPINNAAVPHETLLVLDAAQGRMALDSARVWNKEIGLTGLILTKLDGSARGGSVVSISRDLQLPVKLIGVGEGIEDLRDFNPEGFVDGLLGIGKAGGGKVANEGAMLAARLDDMRKERDSRAKEMKKAAPAAAAVAAPSLLENDDPAPTFDNDGRPRGNPNRSKKKKKKKKRAEQLAMEQGNADQSAVVEEKVPVDVPSNQIPAIIANAASDNFADLKSHSSGTYPAKETAETPIERIPKEHKQKASTIATVDVRRSPEEMEFDSVDKDGLSNKKKKANKVKKEQKNKDSSKKMHVAAYLGSSNSDEIRRTSTESASTVASAEASDSDDDESEEEEHLWIQCDACKKWRIVPTTMSGRLPDTWQCRDNRWDPERMNCAVPQQELEEDEYHVRKRADKKKKKEQKRNSSGTEKSSSSGKKSVAPDGVAKRPRGRPPLGKVWDLELGMYVPIDSSNKHAMPTKVKSEKKVTKKASDQSEKVQSAEPKKRKNDFVDSPELTPKPKKKRKSTPKDGKKKVLKKRKLDPIRDRKRMEKLLEIGRREAKAELEKEKSKVMSKLPVEVKNLFGKIGFAKWGRDCLPALALSPYRVPPGAARDAWMNMFRRMRKNGNPLDEICILVHWYGEEDPDNLFSLLEINKFIPYEESTQEIRNYAKAARQKQKLEKKLTRCDKQRIRAMEQLKLDLIKNPWERQPVDFKERDELLTLEDVEEYLEEESDEEEEEEELLSSPEPEPEKAPVDDGYSTLEDSDDDVEDSPNSPVKKKAAKLVSTAPAVPDLQPSDGVSRENPQSPKSLKIKIGKNKMSQIHSSKSADDETRTTEKSAKPELPLSGNVVPSVATPHISGAVDGARLSEPLLNPSSLQAISNPVAGTGDLTDPLAGDLNDIRVEDLVQTVFMNAKGRAEGSALIGTVMHVVNRLREQRDVALQQCAALSVERANLQAARESDGSDAAADNQDRKRPAQKKESGSAAAAPAVDEGGNSHGSNNEEVLKKHKKE